MRLDRINVMTYSTILVISGCLWAVMWITVLPFIRHIASVLAEVTK